MHITYTGAQLSDKGSYPVSSLISLSTTCFIIITLFLLPDQNLKSFSVATHTFWTKFLIQSNLVITRSSGGIFWDRGISEARYRFCRQGVFFFLILYIFFDCKLLYLLCALPRCTFTTHYVYCIFIRICFIALSKRNQNRCPKQVGFCAVGSQDEAK